MKKIVLMYILMITLIIGLAVLTTVPQWDNIFPFITFSHSSHVIIEGLNSLLMFLIFLVGNQLYSKTKDERLVILAGGFLVSSILNCIHIIIVGAFPFDLLSFANLKHNPTLVYLLFSNLILPLAIYFSLIYKPSEKKTQDFRLRTYTTYFFILSAIIIVPIIVHYFLPALTLDFQIIISSLGFINHSLYLMLAFIILNIRISSKQSFPPIFAMGLIILGLGGLFYINISLAQLNGLLAHLFQMLGLIFLLVGLPRFQILAASMNFKDEIVAYLCLGLISFYVVFISITSALFHIVFPPISAFVFIEFLLVFQLIIYSFSVLSTDKVASVFNLAEREHSMRKVSDTMHRISNQNIIKKTIIDEISNVLKTDRCFIVLYDFQNNSFYFDKYFESLPSNTLMDFNDVHEDDLIFQKIYDLFKNNLEISFTKVEVYIENNLLKNTPVEKLFKEQNIKSFYSIPIKYDNKLFGYLMLHYTHEYRELNNEDLAYVKAMVGQIAKAIHQATL